jgi:hypothetical protein
MRSSPISNDSREGFEHLSASSVVNDLQAKAVQLEDASNETDDVFVLPSDGRPRWRHRLQQ